MEGLKYKFTIYGKEIKGINELEFAINEELYKEDFMHCLNKAHEDVYKASNIKRFEYFVLSTLRQHTKLKEPFASKNLKRAGIILCSDERNNVWIEKRGKKIGEIFKA